MAFFKFRWPGQKGQGNKAAKPSRAPRAESIDVMRRRARHRLIGAAVLVLLGVVGFPMLFDTQPRPIPVDTPIEIPDRNKVAPLVVPAAPAPSARAPDVASLADGEEVVTPAREARKPAAEAPVAQAKPELRAEPKPEPKPVAKPEPKTEPKAPPRLAAEFKPEPKPESKSAVHSDDAARARALLEGRTAQATAHADEGRFIVQIGAFADTDKAREVRQKLERAGLKTYMQVVETKDGKRTRVRVGPFEGRGDADKAAARIKTLDLPASILTL
ncbi:SPOR domain-containing protein [Acidovorax sp. SRB_24]|uniref:SPOR domain-containing protein n=1 Tax=Acidovorax sp. SRB_24 TaxID=1962700 RepID=UPI00145CFD0A|nr:SPOR domain-containing protein [Acidovorax sp. SRB_24]NMM77566.1 sporulation protein [Acidovorax sp. SRB_24]